MRFSSYLSADDAELDAKGCKLFPVHVVVPVDVCFQCTVCSVCSVNIILRST